MAKERVRYWLVQFKADSGNTIDRAMVEGTEDEAIDAAFEELLRLRRLQENRTGRNPRGYVSIYKGFVIERDPERYPPY